MWMKNKKAASGAGIEVISYSTLFLRVQIFVQLSQKDKKLKNYVTHQR